MKRVILASLFMLAASSAYAQQTAPPARPTTTPPRANTPIAPTPAPAGAQTPAIRTPAPTPPNAQGSGRLDPVFAQANRWNIRLEFAITDTYSGSPVKKVVSMIVTNRSNGMIRTNNEIGGYEVLLNVDAIVHANPTPSGQVGDLSLKLTLQYAPAPVPDTAKMGPAKPSGLHESLSVNLVDGKPLLISQSADPVTDRKVTLEVTATVLK